MWPDIEEIYNYVYGRCQTSDSGCVFLIIDLVTVFDAILTSRQTHEKLQ